MSDCKAEILSVAEVLKRNLRIPGYQRPYKWSQRSVSELLNDIVAATKLADKTKYRIGTVILHKDCGVYNVVDGQQRLLTFVLINLALNDRFTCPLLKEDGFQRMLAFDKVSQRNLHDNFLLVKEFVGALSEAERGAITDALEKRLEFVVVCVTKQPEAFQLFDSQNSRGKRLYPHDLLKAFHLREIKDKYAMEHVVIKWESEDSLQIRDLFNCYLYPILCWMSWEKAGSFTEREISLFKGVSSGSPYTYARRVVKAMPCYQLAEQFEAGEQFFGLTEHYLNMRRDVEREVATWNGFRDFVGRGGSTGLGYARRLFYCVLMCYYDRFGNFDRRAIIKLCQWAFMIRVDMEHLGFDTINKYAIGDDSYGKYSNCYSMFRLIKRARSHQEIADLRIKLASEESLKDLNDERRRIGSGLLKLSSGK